VSSKRAYEIGTAPLILASSLAAYVIRHLCRDIHPVPRRLCQRHTCPRSGLGLLMAWRSRPLSRSP
jgi:hypothetical protein